MFRNLWLRYSFRISIYQGVLLLISNNYKVRVCVFDVYIASRDSASASYFFNSMDP